MKYITDEEFNLLLAEMKPSIKNILLIAMETGMRISEILSINYDLIDYDNKKVRLTNTRSGIDHDVILSDEAITIMKTFNSKFIDISGQTIQDAITRAAKKIKLNDINFPCIRNTAIKKLSQKMTFEELANTLGCDPRSNCNFKQYYE